MTRGNHLRLTTLAENTASSTGTLAEHGLAIVVETEGNRVLFDTGQTSTALHNARALGVDLTKLDAIVLSHGHYDHSGGLKDLVREATRGGREIRVIAHPELFSAHYSRRRGEQPRYVGFPFVREEMESLGAHFVLSAEPIELGDEVLTTGEIPMRTPFERVDSGLLLRDGDGWRQDHVPDDLALIVKTQRGLVVVSGCAHRGIVNTLEHARSVTGEDRVYGIVGGTHLGFAPQEQLKATMGAFKEIGIRRLGVSHCTGLKVASLLAQEFGEAFFFNIAGTATDLLNE